MLNSTIYNIPSEQFISAVISSKSIRQILLKLGYSDSFSNYKHIINRCVKEGVKPPTKSKYNSNLESLTSSDRNHYIKLLGTQCMKCGILDWQGKTIKLHLHHIDENHYNNDINNLKLLCPNCHAQQHSKK